MQPDYSLTNGRFELPASARGVLIVPVEHRDRPRPVPVKAVSAGSFRRSFLSFFRR